MNGCIKYSTYIVLCVALIVLSSLTLQTHSSTSTYPENTATHVFVWVCTTHLEQKLPASLSLDNDEINCQSVCLSVCLSVSKQLGPGTNNDLVDTLYYV